MTKPIDDSTIKQIIEYTKDAASVLNSGILNEDDKTKLFEVFHKNQSEILLLAAIPAITEDDNMKIDRLLGAEQIKDTINNTKSLHKLKALLDIGALEIRSEYRQGNPSIEFHSDRFHDRDFMQMFTVTPRINRHSLAVHTEYYDWKDARGHRRATMGEALHNVQDTIQGIVNEWKLQDEAKNENQKTHKSTFTP